MKALELLAALSERDVQLWIEGDQLRYRAPKGVLISEFRDLLLREKEEIMDILRRRARKSVSSHPLSYAQKGLWFMNQAMPGSTDFNVGFAFRIRSSLNITALKWVIQALMDRHPMLRTTYSDNSGVAVQYIHGYMQPEFNEVDASRWDEEEMRQKVIEAHKRSFDLDRGPLLRVFLFKRSDSDYVFLMVGHHIAIDGWSVRVLIDEMRTIYSSQTTGDPVSMPLPEVNHADYVQWQTEMLAGPQGESHWAYWKKQLEGELIPVNLPGRGSQRIDPERKGVSHHFTLNQDLTARIKSLARAEGTTLYTILLAVYLVLLYRYTGQEDILVISPAAGRSRPEFARLVGCLATLIILRFRISGEWTFRELLKQTQKAVLEALDHQDFPFELLPERLHRNTIFGRSELFRVGFALQRPHQPDDFSTVLATVTESTPISFGGIELEPYYIPQGEGHVDLGLDMADDGRGLLWGSLKHDANVLDSFLASQMLGHFRTLLDSVTTHPGSRLWELPLLSDTERHQLLVTRGQTLREYPKDKTLVHLFEDQVERSPEAVAVTYENTQLTYRELNSRSNQLAHRLMKMGVKPEVMVGLYMERSVEMVIGILGILKAGGAYVPLDPVYPKDRLSFMVQDAHMPVVVTQRNLSAELTLNGTARCLYIDDPGFALPADNPPCAIVPENTAYVIYTSGSTGKPKGVLVTHQNVARLFKATDHWFHFGERDVWTLFHSYAFDFSVWELWGALLYGGKLVVVPYWVSRSPDSFSDLLSEQRVTILNQTPSAFRQLIQAELHNPEPVDLALRFVILGGEPLELQSLKPWFDRHGDKQPCLINMYGITETTVHVTYRPIKRADIERGLGSVIGVPIPDLHVYLLDTHRQLVPIGIPGELYVGGEGVSRGYLNHGDLTADRFISDPFCAKPGARLYRTGDLARRLSNGDLEYLGRIDQQVKIRGFRVELGEIEARMNDLDAVSTCVVILREDRPEDQRLVAYYTLKPGRDASSSNWRTYLRSKLPGYMVPQHFVELASIPLTPNGKVDRKALPIPEADSVLEKGYVAPRTETEGKIVAIWQKVLSQEKVGVYNNFFELGGHSLLTTQVLSRLREAFPVNLPLRNLFEATTVAEQGQLIETLLWASQKKESISTSRSGLRREIEI
jgi:amino acid adenylation domain-containing protein